MTRRRLGAALLGLLLAVAPGLVERARGCTGDLSEIAYWARALESVDPLRRLEAIERLAATRASDARPALERAARDPDPAVRAAAAAALDALTRTR